jgi:carboxylesterase
MGQQMKKVLYTISIIIGLAFLLVSCESIKKVPEISSALQSEKNSKNNGKQPIREFYLEGGKTGILLIHGYAASSLTFKPLAYALNQSGYTVYCVLLPGHGTNIKDLDKTKKEDYYKFIDKAYKKFAKKVDHVYVAGHSLGSLLAIRLSAKYRIDGVILLSPPLLVLKEGMSKEQIGETTALLGKILQTLPRPNPAYIGEMDYFEKYGVYSEFSSKSLGVLVEVIQDSREILNKVDDPLLVMLGSHDPLVDLRTGEYVLKSVKSATKSIVIIESIGHRYFLGEKMPVVLRKIVSFIESIEKPDKSLPKSN